MSYWASSSLGHSKGGNGIMLLLWHDRSDPIWPSLLIFLSLCIRLICSLICEIIEKNTKTNYINWSNKKNVLIEVMEGEYIFLKAVYWLVDKRINWQGVNLLDPGHP